MIKRTREQADTLIGYLETKRNEIDREIQTLRTKVTDLVEQKARLYQEIIEINNSVEE